MPGRWRTAFGGCLSAGRSPQKKVEVAPQPPIVSPALLDEKPQEKPVEGIPTTAVTGGTPTTLRSLFVEQQAEGKPVATSPGVAAATDGDIAKAAPGSQSSGNLGALYAAEVDDGEDDVETDDGDDYYQAELELGRAASREPFQGGSIREACDAWLEEEDMEELQLVKLHIYHTDPYTAWMNRAGLRYAEYPIYHAGVEVYGVEWAFQYFDDCWDDDTISGVLPSQPMHMPGFEYQETISMGRTPLDPHEARRLIDSLRDEWPASSYHLTRHNCLTFAKTLIEQLHVPEAFPPMLLGFSNAPEHLPTTDMVVDFGWSWYKWSMQQGCGAPGRLQDDDLPKTGLFSSCCAVQSAAISS